MFLFFRPKKLMFQLYAVKMISFVKWTLSGPHHFYQICSILQFFLLKLLRWLQCFSQIIKVEKYLLIFSCSWFIFWWLSFFSIFISFTQIFVFILPLLFYFFFKGVFLLLSVSLIINLLQSSSSLFSSFSSLVLCFVPL